MLAIGRALMTNPKLLVLDEATEGLAPLIRQEIWDRLAALKREGLSILVIDKNVDALLRLSDRHLILEKGRIVWQGSSTGARRRSARARPLSFDLGPATEASSMKPMKAGVTKAGKGIDNLSWNILGQTYVPKALTESSPSPGTRCCRPAPSCRRTSTPTRTSSSTCWRAGST